jgi:hypothetical protein
MRIYQGGKSENAVLPGYIHNFTSDLFSYFKSTIELCYGILA